MIKYEDYIKKTSRAGGKIKKTKVKSFRDFDYARVRHAH
jgi:hypothetical protein